MNDLQLTLSPFHSKGMQKRNAQKHISHTSAVKKTGYLKTKRNLLFFLLAYAGIMVYLADKFL